MQKVWELTPGGLSALSHLENKHSVSAVSIPASAHSGQDL